MSLAIAEQEKLKEIEEFAVSRIRDRASKVDETSSYPSDLVTEMANLGVFSLYIPREFGGLGFSLSALMETIRIISRECASTSLIPDVTVSLFAEPILKYGSKFLKERYLGRVAKGSIGALAITEPGTGSDAAGIKTTAKRSGSGFVINGGKTFITNGNEAEFFVTSAITNPEEIHHGITLFVLDKEMKGLSVGKEFKKMGIRGTSTTEVLLDNVEVSEEQVIGEINHGFRMEMETLDIGRIGISSQAIGISEGTIRDVMRFYKDSKISPGEESKFTLADMVNLLHSSVSKYREAIEYVDSGRDTALMSSLSKVQAGDAAVEITASGVELLGYNAMLDEYPIERRFREAKITQIYEGTNEIQRLIISREVLRTSSIEF